MKITLFVEKYFNSLNYILRLHVNMRVQSFSFRSLSHPLFVISVYAHECTFRQMKIFKIFRKLFVVHVNRTVRWCGNNSATVLIHPAFILFIFCCPSDTSSGAQKCAFVSVGVRKSKAKSRLNCGCVKYNAFLNETKQNSFSIETIETMQTFVIQHCSIPYVLVHYTKQQHTQTHTHTQSTEDEMIFRMTKKQSN